MSNLKPPHLPEAKRPRAGELYTEFRTFGGYFVVADLDNDGNFRLYPVCPTADAILYVARNAAAIREHADMLYLLCLGDDGLGRNN
jgi:hypothetical protein